MYADYREYLRTRKMAKKHSKKNVANPDNLNMSSESSLQKIEMHSTVVKRSKLKFPNEEGSTASSSKTKNKSCQEEDNDSSSNELDDATSLQRSEVNQTSSPVQEVNLSDVDCLPSIDTVEATHACMIRLRQILKYLPEGNISSEDLKMNLEYTASVLEKVYMDETKYRDKYDGNKTPSLIKDEKPRTTRLKGKGHRRVHKVPELTPPPEHSTIQLSQAEIDHNSNVTIKRRLCDDDDELSEVEPDVVPSEVRDWLALTFTRSMSNMKRRRNQKPKFRSVAQAIRAGIMVDNTIGSLIDIVYGQNYDGI